MNELDYLDDGFPLRLTIRPDGRCIIERFRKWFDGMSDRAEWEPIDMIDELGELRPHRPFQSLDQATPVYESLLARQRARRKRSKMREPNDGDVRILPIPGGLFVIEDYLIDRGDWTSVEPYWEQITVSAADEAGVPSAASHFDSAAAATKVARAYMAAARAQRRAEETATRDREAEEAEFRRLNPPIYLD